MDATDRFSRVNVPYTSRSDHPFGRPECISTDKTLTILPEPSLGAHLMRDMTAVRQHDRLVPILEL